MRALIAAAGNPFAAVRVRALLAEENVVCDATDTGRDSLLLGKLYDYDIILLVLALANGDDYRLLQQLRAAGVRTPILILADRVGLDEKVKFLRFGADDFLTKPFDRRELFARILAIVRRSKGHCESIIRTGKLTVNVDSRVVSVDDRPVQLTPKEYAILELLSLRKGAILTRGMVLNHLYGGMDEPQPKIVDILVCTLRKKIARATGGSDYIDTVRGCGYVLREPATMPIAVAAPTVGPEVASSGRNEVGNRSAAEDAVGRPRRPEAKRLGSSGRSEHRSKVCDRPTDGDWGAASGRKRAPGSFPKDVQFEDAVTSDGGPLRVPRPDPPGSLCGCAAARCGE
jgi:two-component system, cell cycle response regulator CtrA